MREGKAYQLKHFPELGSLSTVPFGLCLGRKTFRDSGDDYVVFVKDESKEITEILEDNTRRMYAYAFRLVSNHSDAEDAVQAVCLRAVRYASKLLGAKNSNAYLMQMVRNESMRLIENRKVIVDEQIAEAGQSPSRSNSVENTDTKDQIQFGLDQVDEKYRNILLAYYFEGLGYQEIADKWGIAIGTVMSRLSRAKSALKSHLEETQVDED